MASTIYKQSKATCYQAPGNVPMPLSCLCFDALGKRVAIAANSNDVSIYELDAQHNQLLLKDTLKGHEQIVCSLDWGPNAGLLVSASHDRTACVWTDVRRCWKKQLVLTRLARAALCVKWAPLENKFAVGSGSKAVSICYFEPENDWWACKLIKKHHRSSVVSVSWHPGGVLLATASTDFKCRVFSAHLAGVDAPSTVQPEREFGELLWEFDVGGSWVHSVAFNPSGTALACCSHASEVLLFSCDELDRFNSGGRLQLRQRIRLGTLPCKYILFLTDKLLLAGGWEGNVCCFVLREGNVWEALGLPCMPPLEGAGQKGPAAPGGDSVSSASHMVARLEMMRLHSTKRPNSSSDADKASVQRAAATHHPGMIVALVPWRDATGQVPGGFLSASSDGKLIHWDLSSWPEALPGPVAAATGSGALLGPLSTPPAGILTGSSLGVQAMPPAAGPQHSVHSGRGDHTPASVDGEGISGYGAVAPSTTACTLGSVEQGTAAFVTAPTDAAAGIDAGSPPLRFSSSGADSEGQVSSGGGGSGSGAGHATRAAVPLQRQLSAAMRERINAFGAADGASMAGGRPSPALPLPPAYRPLGRTSSPGGSGSSTPVRVSGGGSASASGGTATSAVPGGSSNHVGSAAERPAAGIGVKMPNFLRETLPQKVGGALAVHEVVGVDVLHQGSSGQINRGAMGAPSASATVTAAGSVASSASRAAPKPPAWLSQR